MIQINLLIKPKPTNWRKVGLSIGAALVLTAFGFYGFWWTLSYRQLSIEKKALEDLLADYNAMQSGEAKLKEREAQATKEATAIKGLSKNQGKAGQAPVLEGVLRALPAEATLTAVTFQPAGTVEISGRAPRFQTAMACRDAVKVVPGVKEVTDKLLSTTATGETTFTFVAKTDRGVSP